MADDDEIDILGDFTFNSCFAQNSQGIPSCSDREDTVHPQWLLDSTATNWYDNRYREGPLRKLSGTNTIINTRNEFKTLWSKAERECLINEMKKYGRNVRKISQTLKSKTEAEIQALIDAEFGVYLDIPAVEIVKDENQEEVPAVGQEEIVSDEVSPDDPVAMVQTGSPTIKLPPKQLRGKHYKTKPNSLLKPNLFSHEKTELSINPSEILYEDDLVLGSTESIGCDYDPMDTVATNITQAKEKAKVARKLGNHRRKVSRNSDKSKRRNKSKDLLKSPQGRQSKNSSLSEDSTKSPKLQIVLGSGQALPLSEGEQVIKIEKMKDSDLESDIDIDVSSDVEESDQKAATKTNEREAKSSSGISEEPIAVPLRKFEPMPKRQKKFNLDGDGGYTIMHTSAGDMYALGTEPRRERAPKKPTIQLIQCRYYSQDKPPPCRVFMHVSALLLMDAHAHCSSAEVMGLVGGATQGDHEDLMGSTGGATRGDHAELPAVTITRYRPADAAAGHTHCDMDPVSQAVAAGSLQAAGARVLGWHHSHPRFAAAPSARDVASQAALQAALDAPHAPFLSLITSQMWPRAGRAASHYRCFRVEVDSDSPEPVGYQLSVKLVADLTADNLHAFLQELTDVLLRPDTHKDEYSLDLRNDVCPHARLTYLEKCISSMTHHMRSAGYSDDDILLKQLIHYVRDIFR